MGRILLRSLCAGGLLLAACQAGVSGPPLQRPTRPGAASQQEAPPATPAPASAPARARPAPEPHRAAGTTPAPARRGSESGARAGKLVPFSELCTSLSLTLKWTEPEKQFTLTGAFAKLELEVDSRECTINGSRVFLGEPVRLVKGEAHLSQIDAERLVTPMVRPGRGISTVPRLKTIVIDPGHGGVDAGKINAKLGVNEKTFTLDTALRLKKHLEKAGYKVVLTRQDDRFIELADRPEFAERTNADLFVSIHFNSVENKADTVTGVEVFTLAPQWQLSSDQKPDPVYAPLRNPGNEHDYWNSVLGAAFHRELIQELKVSDRGMKRSRFAVLRLAPCPAVLVESGYLSNNDEARRIATPQYRERIAQAMAAAIERYSQSLEAARKVRR